MIRDERGDERGETQNDRYHEDQCQNLKDRIGRSPITFPVWPSTWKR